VPWLSASWKMRHDSATSGPEALAKLYRECGAGDPYDLVILDMQMPDMDGVDVARAIKSDPKLSATRLVVLTSLAYHADESDFRRIGISAYLTKPVKQSDLLDAMAIVLGGEVMGASREATPKRKATRRLKILLAEDNPVNQQVASRILERRGHAVIVAGDGRSALAALEGAHGFDAVLMDVQMPEMDGLEATRAIRERERGAGGGRVPIIAMTAHAMEGDRERCLAAGMDGYISKPVEADDLVRTVERAAGAFDASRAAARLGGDENLLRELLELFLADAPRMVSEVRDAIDAKDAEALRRAAHALKGSVANFGAGGAVDAARRLETMGAAGNLADARAALSELEQALDAFKEEASKGRTS